jgi:sugar phosphate isomerase/epimerase
MFKNLSPVALGVSGRQSELIELALTYSFKGFDLDLDEVMRRVETQGRETTLRFMKSAPLKIGGFELPVRWNGDDADYKADLAALSKVAEFAAEVKALRCVTTIRSGNDDVPYHENFERSRKRLAEICEVLAKYEIQLGVGFEAAAADRAERRFQFICEANPLLLLIKSVGVPNVGLMLDVWNWHLGGGTIEQLKKLTADQIVAVRVADLPSDADPTTVNDTQRLLPGEGGVVDSVAVLALLSEINYEGPVTVYPHPSRFSGMTRDAIVQRASAALDDQWKSAGLAKGGRLALGVE